MRNLSGGINPTPGRGILEKGASSMTLSPCAAGLVVWCAATSAVAKPPAPTAVFNFGFDDTSLQGEMQGPQAAEHRRLAALDAELRDILTKSGCCRMMDLAAVANQAQNIEPRTCNGCDVDLARKAGARISVTGWVQKVSNLILNINIVARDVTTGQVIGAGSVDIRGNTDESWSRGLAYLLRDRLHPSNWQ
jgi:hypothetical protein